MSSSEKLVLGAVDFQNPNWENTVRHAAHRAAAWNARLHLVHVADKPHWLTRRVMDAAALEDYQSSVESAAKARLEGAASLVGDVPLTLEVRTGKPAVELMAALEAQGADLLVTGMEAPSATKMVLGSTGARLLRICPVPIYIAGTKPPKAIERVIVPTGLGPSGSFALSMGAGQLSDPSGEVKALYMVALPSVMNAYSGDVLKLRRDIEAAARVEFDKHVAGVELPAGHAPIVQKLVPNLEIKPAHESIIEEARETGAELICFALGGRGLGGLLIGSVSERVIRAAPCSILALPDSWVSSQ